MTAVERSVQSGYRTSSLSSSYPMDGYRSARQSAQPKILDLIQSVVHMSWRGRDGTSATPASVQFDRQVDKIYLWMDTWGHQTRCQIVERLLRESTYPEVRLLWTVMQPALHRDFMYTALKQFPADDFTPISTHTGRQVINQLHKTNRLDFHRIQSAHIQQLSSTTPNGNQREKTLPLIKTSVRMPRLVNVAPRGMENMASCSRMSKFTTMSKSSTKNSKKTHQALNRSLWTSEHRGDSWWENSQTPPSRLRFTAMPLRRHVQEESNPNRDITDDVSYDLFDDCNSVGQGPAHPIVPVLTNRGHYLPVPISILTNTTSANIPPKSTDTNCSKSKIKLKVKVKVNATPVAKSPIAKSPISKLPIEDKRVRETTISVLTAPQGDEMIDIPPEGWRLIHWFTFTWTHLQRTEFLQKLLLKLDPRQQYYISSVLSVKHHVDIVGLLPEHLAVCILANLSPTQLVVASRTSKRWNELCNNNLLWGIKCNEIRLEIPIGSGNPDWKGLFRQNKFVSANWSTGNCTVIECKGHIDKVLSVIFDDKKMATGSADKTIRIWDLRDGRCIQTLKGHVKGVWALRFFTDNLIVSASYDSTLRVWTLRDGVCQRTLVGHGGPVWAIELYGTTLVSASQDGTAKVWDISRCLAQRSLKGHSGPVFCVDLNNEGKMAITGSSDKTIRLWDTETGDQIRVIWGATNSVMAVSCSNGWIAASHGTFLSLYSLAGALHAKYDGHIKRIECLKLRVKDSYQPSGVIISAGKDGVMKQWDIVRGECIKTFAVSKHQVNCVHFDEIRIASAAYDNKIKLWDFSASKNPFAPTIRQPSPIKPTARPAR